MKQHLNVAGTQRRRITIDGKLYRVIGTRGESWVVELASLTRGYWQAWQDTRISLYNPATGQRS